MLEIRNPKSEIRPAATARQRGEKKSEFRRKPCHFRYDTPTGSVFRAENSGNINKVSLCRSQVDSPIRRIPNNYKLGLDFNFGLRISRLEFRISFGFRHLIFGLSPRA
jgi:hypothetical protein